MKRHRPGIPLNGAPSQYDRWSRSLGPDSVRIDTRPFTELLSFAPQFGRLVKFYDLADLPDGDWTPFFLTDPTIILASILALDLRSIEQTFLISLQQARESQNRATQRERLRACFESILDLARQIDSWFGGAQINRQSAIARLFALEAAAWIGSSLSRHLRQLKALVHASASHDTLDISIEVEFKFSSHWKLAHAGHGAPFRGKETRSAALDHLASELDEISQAFHDALRHLQSFAAKHLPQTLREPYHKPQIALYIAFVRLFQTAQRTLNTLTRRFKRFYDQDILREKNAGPIPDSVYLTFVLDPTAGVDAATVPLGTQFPAGEEADGSNILYAANAGISVSAAALASVRALRVVTGPLYTTGVSSPPGVESPPATLAAQQVLGTQIDVKLMNDKAAGKGPADGPMAWSTFGNSVSGTGDIATTAPVTLGFAIASPYLMLTGGGREVTLTFHLTPGSGQIDSDLRSLSEVSGIDSASVFEQMLSAAFDLYLSTVGGWFHVDSYSCICSPLPRNSPRAPEWFSLVFTLSSSAPPIVAFSPATDAPSLSGPPVPDDLNPAAGLPTLKAYLRPTPATLDGANDEVRTYPLSLLAHLAIERIEIATDTTDLTNLQIENTTGLVDSASPFPVFGGIPVTGSFLQFRHPELFVKKPDTGSFQVKLSWFGLPANDDGFTGYYQGYVVGVDGRISPTVLFDNRTFCGRIQVQNPGAWDLLDASPTSITSPPEESELYLFRTQNDCFNPVPTPDGSLCLATTFDTLQVIDAVPPSYYDPASSAIRLTLTAPSYGFGNILYAPNVLNAAIAELPKTGKEPSAPPACQPLQDAANSLAAIVPPGAQPPARSQVQSAVQQAQERLIQAAEGYLSGSLAKYGQDAVAWVGQTFAVSGSNAPPYRAQTIRARLQDGQPPIENSGSLTSPPYIPTAAADAIRNSRRILQAVVWMQQSLDHCAAQTESSYGKCIEAQLSACQQKLRQSCAACVKEQQPVSYPNPPWQPQAQGLSVDYSAHCGFAPAAAAESCGSYFYLLPFGGYRAISEEEETVPMLPVPDPGNLELGFSGLAAAQRLDLLVQMCAGNVANPPAVSWQYFEWNTWKAFDTAQVPADTTNGLQNTGIVGFDIPADKAGLQTAARDNYRWLRAVTQDPDRFPDTVGIYPHPLIASWVSDGGGSGQHLKKPLPPNTITSSVQNLSAIKAINQPIESFGGRPAEDNKTFQARLAERLRHKDRAILVWDYEQLVLERFPTIWKVQTLPAASTNGMSDPGCVLVVVVAGPESIQVADSTEPLATSAMLKQIRSYLAPLASPFAGIQVVNPVYVRIRVNAEVMFQSDKGGGGIDRLNSDLVAYLSPWFYNAARAGAGGDYASEDAISRFIQTRPYVAALIEIGYEYDPFPETLDWYFLTSAKSHSICEADASTLYRGEQACLQHWPAMAGR